MKALQLGIISAIFLLHTSNLLAQSGGIQRQAIFKNSSDRLPVAGNELAKAFSAQAGSTISFKFSNLAFSGEVISAADHSPKQRTVIVRSSDLNNSLLSITRRVNEDMSVSYEGRIINQNSADGFELKRNEDGSYSFNKIKTADLLQDL